MGRLLLGDDTREVLEDAPCAVAIAPAGYASRAASIRMIGVAYDRSVESERALELARTLAAHHQAELSALEAIRPPVHGRDPANVAGESQERVEEARRRIPALGGVHADASFGDAVDELRQYGPSVDLLVISSHKVRTDRPRAGGKHLPAAGGRAVLAAARPRRPMSATLVAAAVTGPQGRGAALPTMDRARHPPRAPRTDLSVHPGVHHPGEITRNM